MPFVSREQSQVVWLKKGQEIHIGECRFLRRDEELSMDDWDIGIQGDAHSSDAAEFGHLAHKRWRYYRDQSLIAGSIRDLQERIRIDPDVELGMICVVGSDRLSPPSCLGLAFFRRTWANHLCLDFLAKHPATTDQINGIGYGLLDFIVNVAKEINAGSIWGETTKGSVDFYKKAFDRKNFDDRFSLPKSRYSWFKARRLGSNLQSASEALGKARQLHAPQNRPTISPK